MNNENNEVKDNVNTTTSEEAASDASKIIMPGIPDEFMPKEETKVEVAPEASVNNRKKKQKKQLMLLLGIVGALVIFTVGFMLISSMSTPTVKPITIPNQNGDTIEAMKEEIITGLNEKTLELKGTIKDTGSYDDSVDTLKYSVFEIDNNKIGNYEISLTGSETLELYYIRYYNMTYNFVELSSLNKYDKLYLVVYNTSTINSYNYVINFNTKKTYNAAAYNNYTVKISYTANEGNVSSLYAVNAIYDEVHQRKYLRVPVPYKNVGTATMQVYDDVASGERYAKLPSSQAWTRSQIPVNKFNLKNLEEYILREDEGVTRISGSVYKAEISSDMIKGLMYEMEPLETATATITITNKRISKISYEFGDNVDSFKGLVMTIDISDVNNSGDVNIPTEALK